MFCWGAGDVAGVVSENGRSEKVTEDGLDGTEEDGKELMVPVGEFSGVNTSGRSVLAAVWWVKRPCEFRSWGSVRWDASAAL
jgi:hypothetical protein